MPRPVKIGFDYFPLDTKFDVEMETLIAMHGHSGLSVIVSIWQLCYSEKGCYCEWGETREMYLSGKLRVSSELFRIILEDIFRLGILHRNLYEKHGFLTSRGILKRYISMCISSKRIGVIPEEMSVIPEFNEVIPENFGIYATKKKKVKNSKVKKTKPKEINPSVEAPDDSEKQPNPFKEIWKAAIDAWLRLLKIYADGGKFGKGDGSALKEILERCQQKVESNEGVATMQRVLEFWQTFLGTWPKWEKFHQQARLPFINQQFDTIYLKLKNGNTTGNGIASVNTTELAALNKKLAEERAASVGKPSTS